jgi:hypothetical protein
MAINISAIQMRNGNLPMLVRGIMEAFELKAENLMFEITESAAMEQPTETVRILDLLHDMGISIAIDDFGTGYSSLSYLHMFPINHLKLDRSFVSEIGDDTDGSVICDATIGLAHSLGQKVVAEGIETDEQLSYLKRSGDGAGLSVQPPITGRSAHRLHSPAQFLKTLALRFSFPYDSNERMNHRRTPWRKSARPIPANAFSMPPSACSWRMATKARRCARSPARLGSILPR